MRVLVTGANGFLGRHVVVALLGRGHNVRAMVRPAARFEDLGWPPSLEVFRADVRSTRYLEPAFDGVDALVHLAAPVANGEDLFVGCVVGTERLLEAMSRTSCRRVILVSSFSVYDWSAISRNLDENSPVEPAPDLYDRDDYAIAKSWQEKVTRRFAERHGWDLTVLRPGFIWGRDRGYIAALGQRLGRLHIVIGPLSRIPLTHVENCADLVAQSVSHPRARGETFNVVDDDGPRIWSYLGAYLRGTGERGIRIPVPYHLASSLVRLAHATIFKRSMRLPNLLIPCRFESRLKPLRYSNRRARELLGWSPPLAFRECLSRSYGPSGPSPRSAVMIPLAPAPTPVPSVPTPSPPVR
jgi:nucleoside-diphosphate-sugar epimerase